MTDVKQYSGNQLFLRELNTITALRAVRARGPLSRAELAQLLGLNRSTITAIAGRLIESELVLEAGQGESSGGRPPTMLRFNDEAAYVACAEWSSSKIGLYVSDMGGKIVYSGELSRNPRRPYRDEIREAAGMLRATVASLPRKPHGLLGVALGVPGVVDRESETVSSYDLGWDIVPLAALFRETFDAPVIVENIANLCLTAERDYGAAAGEEHVCYIRLRQGITAGILINGQIYRGAYGFAGNVGHTIVESQGVVCTCGSRGCWKNYASDDALLRMFARAAELPSAAMVDFIHRVRSDDRAAKTVLETFAGYVGIGIANLINTMNPGAVVVDSALNEIGARFGEALQAVVERAALTYPRRDVKLLFSALGSRAVVLGAAAAIFDRTFEPPKVVPL